MTSSVVPDTQRDFLLNSPTVYLKGCVACVTRLAEKPVKGFQAPICVLRSCTFVPILPLMMILIVVQEDYLANNSSLLMDILFCSQGTPCSMHVLFCRPSRNMFPRRTATEPCSPCSDTKPKSYIVVYIPIIYTLYIYIFVHTIIHHSIF